MIACNEDDISVAPRRRVLGGLLAMAAFAVPLAMAIPASAQQFTRVIVTLRNRDRDREVQELFNALSGMEYRLIEAYQDRPVLILDVNAQALRRLRELPMVAQVSQDGVTPLPGGETPRPQQPGGPLLTCALTIRSGTNFDRALREIRRRLDGVRHEIVSTDPGKRRIVISISERDMPIVGALDIVQSAVVVQQGGKPPAPQPAPSSQRYIVQYGGGDPRREIRRIRRAMDGLPFTIARHMEASRMIVVETNQRGFRRLQQIDGIRVWRDELSRPQ
ncbi:MAG TPA: hypothetical protein VNS02_11900 [Rhizobiaceae bacterium]|nr:hypothetical protein [Rhizobiaceae bacterium]